MATGRVGAEDLAANTDTTVYQCPIETFAAVSANICNRNNLPVLISLSVCASETPELDECIEFETELPARGTLERTGIVLAADQYLVIRSNSANVNIVAYGIESTLVAPGSTAPAPTYAVAPAANNVDEGSNLGFTVTTTNVSNGTTLYWTVTNAGDFATSSGSFTVNSNSGTFSVTPSADATTEGAETFTASVRRGGTSGTIVATSSSVTINDTSQAAVTSFYGNTGQSTTVSSSRLSLITTAQSRFGTHSLQKTPVSGFGGRANSVNIPLSQTLGAPMTLEAWVWVGAGYSSPNFEGGPNLMLHGPAVDQATVNPTNSISFGCFGPNSSGSSSSVNVSRIPPDNTASVANDQNNTPIPLNTWTHIALVQSDSTNFATWVNGTRRQRNTWGSGYGLASVMTQLTLNSSGDVGPHYIDEIRVSNIARYGVDNTTITVPSVEFVSDANTVALVKF